MLDGGDFDAASTAYQAILDGDPNHSEARGALRQIAFLQRASGVAPDSVAVADAAPDDIDAALAAADAQILAQDVAGPTGGRSGAPPGRTTVAVAGPVARTEVIETGTTERGDNMVRFTTLALRFLRDAILDAPAGAKAD